ncbi:MAG: hypothetical protein M1514_02695 [Patescibacteria group bacterium]|nr:hypothetical protein [Patescibacteria group bacterium]
MADFGAVVGEKINTVVSGGIALAALGFLATTWGSVALASWIHEKERANRISFGQLLTVSKVAVFDQERLTKTFPEVLSYPYVGELHFLGKSRIPRVGSNPLTVVREGFESLYNLAEACERKDKVLEGIEIFLW